MLVRLLLLAVVLLLSSATVPLAVADVGERGDAHGWSQSPDEIVDEGWGEDSEGAIPAPETAPAPSTPAPGPIPEVPPVKEPEADRPALAPVRGSFVKGRVARMRTDGKAAIPRGAPKRVRRMIAAANRIVGKPYKWGGGHALVEDRGYDCSGTVSYALIRSGQLTSPLVSGSFARWGSAGAGKYVTIYANKGHVYVEIAGLRLDTSAVGDPRGGEGPRWRPIIGARPGFKVRHVPGL